MSKRFPIAIPLLAIATLTAFSCGGEGGEGQADPRLDQARELAHRIIVADTHIDLPYRLREKAEDVGERTEGGDFDYPRAVEGGLDLAFLAVFVPPSYQESGGARLLADELIDTVEGIADDHPDKFFLATSVQEVTDLTGQGRIALALGMENGAGIEDDLSNLSHFHSRGIRYITLAHGKSNLICDSSHDEERQWRGLSPFGRDAVEEMNRLGMMIDVSHVTDESFFDVLELTEAPVIASHSACRAFTPGWERNMSDEMIRRLAESGGVIQIPFGSSFVDGDYQRAHSGQWDEIGKYLESNSIEPDSDEARRYRKSYFAEHPLEPAGVSAVADQIDHVVRLVGVDHVGLGSEFDGLGESAVSGLKSVADYPNLIRELLVRGYGEQDVQLSLIHI